MLTQEELPERLIRPCLNVMKEILPDEREFIRVVVEVVHEMRDTEDTSEGVTSTVCRLSTSYPILILTYLITSSHHRMVKLSQI